MISESKMNSCDAVRSHFRFTHVCLRAIDLSNVRTYLPNLGQKLDARHPLLMAEPRLSRKVVDVLDQSLKDVLQPGIGTLAIDQLDIVGNVVDRQVFELWNVNL